MSELEAYLQFRKEIDTMFYPKYSEMCDVSTLTDSEGNVYALMIVEDGYIDCLWVKEDCRGKGHGYELIVKHCLEVGMPVTLRILHNNYRAREFWNKVFELRVLESNPYDSLYAICGFKGRVNEQNKG